MSEYVQSMHRAMDALPRWDNFLDTHRDLLYEFFQLDEGGKNIYMRYAQFLLLRLRCFGQTIDYVQAFKTLRLLREVGHLQDSDLFNLHWNVHDAVNLARSKIVTLERLQERIEWARDDGEKISFMHGHYRFTTLGHFYSCLYALYHYPGCHVLGVDSNLRTRLFKTDDLPFGDIERITALAVILPVNYILLIEDTEGYSHEFYLQLIGQIRPDYYLTEEIAEERLSGRRLIAETVGAELGIIPHFDFPSTSEIFKVIRRLGSDI